MSFFKEMFIPRINITITNTMHPKLRTGLAFLKKHETQGFIYLIQAKKQEMQVVAFDWAENIDHYRSGGKAVGGALIGSLAGIPGMMIGAAIGGKRRENDNSYAILTVIYENKEYDIKFKCDERDFKTIQNNFLK